MRSRLKATFFPDTILHPHRYGNCMTYWYGALLRQDFSTFIGKTLETVDPGASYIPNWHIDLIAEHLEAARRGEITRLMINMPPRSLKSVCVSVAS